MTCDFLRSSATHGSPMTAESAAQVKLGEPETGRSAWDQMQAARPAQDIAAVSSVTRTKGNERSACEARSPVRLAFPPGESAHSWGWTTCRTYRPAARLRRA